MERLYILTIAIIILTPLTIAIIDLYIHKNKIHIYKIALTIMSVLILYLGLFITIPIEYSKGERSGTLVKLSRTGFLFKTYEGKLKLGNEHTGDAGSSMFTFSIHDENIAKELNKYIGKHVKLYYTQYPLVSITKGSTSYNITKVKGDY